MLWYDTEAEEAANFYVGVFGGEIHSVNRRPDGQAFTVEFSILGSRYNALNGGPMFKFSEAFSIFITVDGQTEVDKYWDALLADGGEPGNCGWLKDRFGLSWQIVPIQLGRALGNPDPVKSAAAMQAMLGMGKLIVAELEAAVA
jgi:predicted 3-demethylubiquinone-9 3-methyltransferase (glyoxalase superfamily)